MLIVKLKSFFRLWAEVFHVSASGAGTVKWQQVSEDLVPVNITCIQDSPECVFHITAYNSQVDKILDVRLVQPGKNTRVGSFNAEINFVHIFRDENRTGFGMLRVLEGSYDERHVGLKFYLADRREAIQRVLCKYITLFLHVPPRSGPHPTLNFHRIAHAHSLASRKALLHSKRIGFVTKIIVLLRY